LRMMTLAPLRVPDRKTAVGAPGAVAKRDGRPVSS
jgi:hypothetical protein